jgi:FkbM family methyltransferase
MLDAKRSKCVVDVGANHGLFALEVAKRNPDVKVVAIEPAPHLAEFLRCRAYDFSLSNIIVVEAAVGTTRHRGALHVSFQGDGGTSSLMCYDDAAIANNEYWVGRTDLYFSTTVDVDVVPLGEILRELEIEAVDFLKIDTQGYDLQVLKSMYGSPVRIRAGMLEAAATERTRLYSEGPTVLEALTYLESQSLIAHSLKANDPACAEVNIFFRCAETEWEAVVESLNLRGISIFDGVDYWYNPSRIPPHEMRHSVGELERAMIGEGIAWKVVAELRASLRNEQDLVHELRSELMQAWRRESLLRELPMTSRDTADPRSNIHSGNGTQIFQSVRRSMRLVSSAAKGKSIDG